MTMNDVNSIISEQCCENCSNNQADKTKGVCVTCSKNPRYSNHFSENETIKRLKAALSEKEKAI